MGFLSAVLLAVTTEAVAMNVATGIAIVLVMLVLRAGIGLMGRAYLARTVCTVVVNVPAESEAVEIGRRLLEEGLVAAVNVTAPIRSFYRWEGRLEDRAEVVLILKTTLARADEVVRRATALHSYRVPSILVFPASPRSHGGYRGWVREAVGCGSWWRTATVDDILPTRPIWKR